MKKYIQIFLKYAIIKEAKKQEKGIKLGGSYEE